VSAEISSEGGKFVSAGVTSERGEFLNIFESPVREENL
jgi:hypothetical protein